MFAFLMCFMLAVNSAKIMEKCQMPGNAICKSTDMPGFKFTSCCDDSIVKCLPWTGEGYVAGDEPDSFCQYVDPIPVGGDCSGMRGSCEKSSSCIGGICNDGEGDIPGTGFGG